jgi:putative transposase
MRGPQPPPVELNEEDRRALERLVRRKSTGQQVALRARIILAAADGLNNAQIGRQVGVEADTVRRWRGRWRRLQAVDRTELSVAERLGDAPRPGAPARITAEQVCRIVALACEAPSASGRPISQWTGREIADELVRRGIVEGISPRHAGRLLKRGTSSPTASATG